MNIFKIKTTAWEEDSFILITQLSEKQVKSIIQPMVDEARENDFVFTTDDYVRTLRDAYNKSVIITYDDEYQEVTF